MPDSIPGSEKKPACEIYKKEEPQILVFEIEYESQVKIDTHQSEISKKSISNQKLNCSNEHE